MVLVNSNPATIMTDPEMADQTYIEPITPASGGCKMHRARSDRTPCLPTLGGQTGLEHGHGSVHEMGVF